MRGMDFHRAAALGERHKRAIHDRMTKKHRADKQSRAWRGIQAMMRLRCQRNPQLLCAYAKLFSLRRRQARGDSAPRFAAADFA